MKFHHIGIATENIELSAKTYELLGYKKGEIIKDLKDIGFRGVILSPFPKKINIRQI